MASVSSSIKGKCTLINGFTDVWHEMHNNTPGYTGLQCSGSVTFTRNNGDKVVSVTGSITNKIVGVDGSYEYRIPIGVVVNGTFKNVEYNAYDKVNIHTQSAPIKQNNTSGAPGSTTSINISFDNYDSTGVMHLCLYCGQYGGCSVGYTGWTEVASIDISKIPYYTAPTYDIKSITQIGIVNETNYNVNYKIEDGTNSIAWTNIKLYNSNNQHIKSYDLQTTDKGSSINKQFKLYTNDGFTDGTQYKGSIRFYDSYSEYETKTLNLYTYKTPTISDLSLSTYDFSGFGGVDLYWNTNGRRWQTSLEQDFKTYIEIPIMNKILESTNNNPNNPGTNGTPSSKQTQILTQSQIMDNISTEKLSTTEVFNTTIRMSRKNISSGVIAYTDKKNITIQIKPKYKPNSITYYDWSDTATNNIGKLITQGDTLYIDEHPYILVKWELPNSLDRGNTSGYIVTVYDKNGNKLNNGEHIVKANNIDSRTGQIKLNIKTDLKRGELNYIGVRAYYEKPNKSGNMEGPELKQSFILPLGKIHKPVISYPITNTTWHNTKFRILLQSPKDDDYDTYSTDIQNGDYRYKDINVEINGVVYSFKDNPNIFSVNSLTYQDHICINPSLLNNFPNASSYKIRIQYQKNYYVNVWSEWSTEVILNIQSIKELNLQQYNAILYTQYNTVRNNSYRLWCVYPIISLDINNKEVKKGDIIYQYQYQAIYNTILNIQKGINNYATYDKIQCKMNESITKLSTPNNVTTDIITAIKDARPTIQGRNYKNILIECMNKLF